MKIDPKFRNLVIFCSKIIWAICLFIYLYIKLTGENNIIRLIGHFVILLIAARCILWVYRRHVKRTQQDWKFSKWIIILDNGDAYCLLTLAFVLNFANSNDYSNMNICIISSSQCKLDAIKCHVSSQHENFNDANKIKSNLERVFYKLITSDMLVNESLIETFIHELENNSDNSNNNRGIGIFVNTLCYNVLNHENCHEDSGHLNVLNINNFSSNNENINENTCSQKKPSSTAFQLKQFDSETEYKDIDALIEQTLLPSVYWSSLVLQSMIRCGISGVILHVASSLCQQPLPYLSVPSSTR